MHNGALSLGADVFLVERNSSLAAIEVPTCTYEYLHSHLHTSENGILVVELHEL